MGHRERSRRPGHRQRGPVISAAPAAVGRLALAGRLPPQRWSQSTRTGQALSTPELIRRALAFLSPTGRSSGREDGSQTGGCAQECKRIRGPHLRLITPGAKERPITVSRVRVPWAHACRLTPGPGRPGPAGPGCGPRRAPPDRRARRPPPVRRRASPGESAGQTPGQPG